MLPCTTVNGLCDPSVRSQRKLHLGYDPTQQVVPCKVLEWIVAFELRVTQATAEDTWHLAWPSAYNLAPAMCT